MESRIASIKETTSRIEAPPEPTLKAITAGTEVTKNAAQNGLVEKSKQSPLNRFGILFTSTKSGQFHLLTLFLVITED